MPIWQFGDLMICRFAGLSIWRFDDLARGVWDFDCEHIETSPQPPSKGEPIHEHYTNDYEQHTNDYEDYTNDLLIDKLAHWQIDSLAN